MCQDSIFNTKQLALPPPSFTTFSKKHSIDTITAAAAAAAAEQQQQPQQQPRQQPQHGPTFYPA